MLRRKRAAIGVFMLCAMLVPGTTANAEEGVGGSCGTMIEGYLRAGGYAHDGSLSLYSQGYNSHPNITDLHPDPVAGHWEQHSVHELGCS